MAPSANPRSLVLVVAGLLVLGAFSVTGQTLVTTPAPVNSDAVGPGPPACILPAIALGAPGHAIAAWTQHTALFPPDHQIFASHTFDGGATWSPSVLASGAWTLCMNPELAVDSSGHAILVWNRLSVIEGAQSYDHGQTWTPPAFMSGGQGRPRIATDGLGTWIAACSLSGTGGLDIACARSTDDGQNWTLSPLNTDAPWDGFADQDARIATDGFGNWVVVWIRIAAQIDVWSLAAAHSTDGGYTWTVPQFIAVVGYPVGIQILDGYELAVGGGRWQIVGSCLGDIYRSYSDDLGMTWTPAEALTSTLSEDRLPVLSGDDSGQWMVAWQSREPGTTPYHILTIRSGDGGNTWSTPVPVPYPAPFTAGDDTDPAISNDGDGNWQMLWQSTNDLGGTIGNDADILCARAVGPCPASSLTLTASNPTPNNYLLALTASGFTPGNQYFTCFTYELGEHPSGPWFGIDPLDTELILQATTLAPPFNGSFDAAGTSTFSWTAWSTPGPLGITLYAVTIEHVAGSILRASPPTASVL